MGGEQRFPPACRGRSTGLTYCGVPTSHIARQIRYNAAGGEERICNLVWLCRVFDASLKAAFGVSYQQFDRDWRAWLKKY
jgi:hypothetical protein